MLVWKAIETEEFSTWFHSQFYERLLPMADKLFDEYLAEIQSESKKASKEKKNGKRKR